MASAAAAAVAAKGAGTALLNAVSCPQIMVYHRCRMLPLPGLAGKSREALTTVRRHSMRVLYAVRSSPQIEAEIEEKSWNNGAVEESMVEEVSLALAETLLQNYAAALCRGDEEVLSDVKAQLQAMIDQRDLFSCQVETLKMEIGTGTDRFLRLNADFENFRRRSSLEKGALSDSAKANVIESLLPMIDSFERAKASIKAETEGEQNIDNSYQGIHKQFVEIMKGLGVSVVETVGKAFDPEVHEAIMREESDKYPENAISEEFRRGFKLGDTLVRPAMVKVSSGPGVSSTGALDPLLETSETLVSLEPEEQNS